MTELVVITPAHNEAVTLPALAASMAGQTRRPDHWVIVSDRSSDQTLELAQGLSRAHRNITALERTDSGERRTFSHKVRAFMAGFDHVAADGPSFIACVDADVSLPPDYFQRVITAFEADPELGVCGGAYIDPQGKVGRHGGGSVPGPAQVFRFQTFREINGFRPLPFGGEDAMACTEARRQGWKTEVVPGLHYRHLREMGAGGGRSRLRAAFDHGRQDYDVGMGPVFEVVRLMARVGLRPIGLVALFRMLGYVVGALARSRTVTPEVMEFSRTEQHTRLRNGLRRYVPALR